MDEAGELEPGDVVTDRESDEGDELVVVDVTDKRIDDVVIGWDWQKNEITVADANEDSPFYEEYKDDHVVKVIYVNNLSNRHNVEKEDFNKIKELVDDEKLKTFSFPRNRLLLK